MPAEWSHGTAVQEAHDFPEDRRGRLPRVRNSLALRNEKEPPGLTGWDGFLDSGHRLDRGLRGRSNCDLQVSMLLQVTNNQLYTIKGIYSLI